MKFFEEMLTKFGFSDGNAVPIGVEHYRKAYVLTINRLAERFGSTVRAVAYDRGGMHNWCLILFADCASTEDMTEDQLADGSIVFPASVEAKTDEPMDRAIQYAMTEIMPDCYVTCRVSLSKASIRELLRIAADAPLPSETKA